MPELRRRCCVEPPDLAITNCDPADYVIDLRNRLGQAIHLFGEPIPLSQNSLMLGLQTAIRFERLQGLDPFGKLAEASCRRSANAPCSSVLTKSAMPRGRFSA